MDRVKEASFSDLGGLELNLDDLGYYGSVEDLVEQLIGGDEPMAEVKDQSEDDFIDDIIKARVDEECQPLRRRRSQRLVDRKVDRKREEERSADEYAVGAAKRGRVTVVTKEAKGEILDKNQNLSSSSDDSTEIQDDEENEEDKIMVPTGRKIF